MRLMTQHIAISIMVFGSLISCLSEPFDAIVVAKQFCKFDANAIRLDSSISRPIWELTVNDGEPPSYPIFIISGFDVSERSKNEGEISIKISYTIIGSLKGEEPTLVQELSKTEIKYIYLIKTNSGWKIDITRLKIPPHVFPLPLMNYYKGLLADTPNEDQYANRRNDLMNVIFKLKKMTKTKTVPEY